MTTSAQRKRRSPRRPAEWARIVKDWQNSGLSATEYAKRHDLGAPNLWRWSTKLQLRAGRRHTVVDDAITPTGFIPVQVSRHQGPGERPPQKRLQGSIELELTNGCVVRLRGEVSPDALKAALSALA